MQKLANKRRATRATIRDDMRLDAQFAVEHGPLAEKLADQVLARFSENGEMKREVKLNQEQVADLVSTIVAGLPEGIGSAKLARSKLRARLLALRHERKWETALPGLAFRAFEEFPEVTGYHLHASKIIRKLRRRVLAPPSAQNGDYDADVQRAVAALALYTPHTDAGSVVLALRHLGLAYRHRTLSGALIIPIPQSADSGEKRSDRPFAPIPRDRAVLTAAHASAPAPALRIRAKTVGDLDFRDLIRAARITNPIILLPCTAVDFDRALSANRAYPAAAAIDRTPCLPALEVDEAGSREPDDWIPLVLSGPAAIAVLPLMKAINNQDRAIRLPVTEAEVSKCLHAWLGDAAPGLGVRSCWKVLSGIVELCIRFERFGAVPGTSFGHRSAVLSCDRTSALLNNAARGKAPPTVDDPDSSNGRQRRPHSRPQILKTDRKAYDDLRSLFSRIARRNKRSAEDIGDIDAIEERAGSNLLYVIDFARYIFSRRKRGHSAAARKDPLRTSSLYQYLASIGGPLLNALGTQRLKDLSSDELLEVYSDVISAKPIASRQYTFDRLLEFHRSALRPLADVDFGELADELPDYEQQARAAFLTAAETAVSDSQVEQWRRRSDGDSLAARRSRHLYDISAVAMPLMRHAGLRPSEMRRIRIKDVYRYGNVTLLHIRSNQFGSVKSRAGVRLLSLAYLLPDKDLKAFNDYYDRARRRVAGSTEGDWELCPVFSSVESPTLPVEAARLTTIVKRALVVATGQADARPYWSRHTCATTWLMSVTLPNGLVESFPVASHFRQRAEALQLDIRVRAMAMSRMLGHARLRTSLASYYHLQYLDLASFDGPLPDQKVLEALLGLRSGYIADWIHKRKSRSAADLIDQLLDAGGVRLDEEPIARHRLDTRTPLGDDVDPPLTIGMIAALLLDVRKGETWEPLSLRYPVTLKQAQALAQEILEWQGRRDTWIVPRKQLATFLGDTTGGILAAVASKAVKVKSARLLGLATKLDEANLSREDAKALGDAANCFFRGSGFRPYLESQLLAMQRLSKLLHGNLDCTNSPTFGQLGADSHLWFALVVADTLPKLSTRTLLI